MFSLLRHGSSPAAASTAGDSATWYSRVKAWYEILRPYFKARNKKPLRVQAAEMYLLMRKYRRLPDQYLKLGLYNSKMSGPVDDYMSPKQIMPFILSRNNPDDVEIVRNKVLLRRALKQTDIPVVRELFSIERDGVISDDEGREIDAGEARAVLRRHDDDVFVKPLRGRWGIGAHLLARDAIPADFPSGMKDIVVQPVIRQHPLLDAIYPNAVNTVRIDTLRTEDGIVSNAAVLRIGAGGEVVDNGSAGGLVVGLDLDTGRLRSVAWKKPEYGDDWYERHPDTGVRFADLTVPFWRELRAVIARAAEHLPFGALGWDAAVTPEGPLIVEANSYGGIIVMQIGWGGLGSTELGRRARRFHGLPVRDEDGAAGPAVAAPGARA